MLRWLQACQDAELRNRSDYIREIVFKIWMRQDAVFSQASVRIAGQRPAAFSAAVRMDTGMRIPVRGNAKRFVRRK